MATNAMATNAMARDLATLGRLSVNRLRERYAEVYGELTPGRNKAWLVKRIAWRIQALAEGGLSERTSARRTPGERRRPAIEPATANTPTRPCAGSGVGIFRRRAAPGGGHYSLSAVATAITGSHLNGYRFFHLDAKGGDS